MGRGRRRRRVRPDGTPLFQLTFDGLFSYRAVPVEESLLSATELRAGMNAMAAKAAAAAH